jgi:hypothetical protein
MSGAQKKPMGLEDENPDLSCWWGLHLPFILCAPLILEPAYQQSISNQ